MHSSLQVIYLVFIAAGVLLTHNLFRNQLSYYKTNQVHHLRPLRNKPIFSTHKPIKRLSSATDIRKLQNAYQDFPKITLMVRTGAVPRLLYQFFCMFLRTTTLFWPAIYGDIAVVLDAESRRDHKFGDILQRQFRIHYKEYNLSVHYEQLPNNSDTLYNSARPSAYVRQLWSTFFADRYSKERIIAYMDTDTLFLTPMTKEYLMEGDRLKVFANGDLSLFWLPHWRNSTRQAIGLPMVANFMVTFPQLIYRSTYRNCRAHIMKHLGVADFEKAFRLFHTNDSMMSPINIIMSYAWFFEHERYDWHIKVLDLKAHNRQLPAGHRISLEETIPSIVGVAHISDVKKWEQDIVTPGYCLAMKAQGQPVDGCTNVTHNIEEICDFYESVFQSQWPSASVDVWCRGGNFTACCERFINEHYENVSYMARMYVHVVKKENANIVSTLAREMGIGCEHLCMP